MANQTVTVADILAHLRDAIVEARNRGDGDELSKLEIVVCTLGLIAEGTSEESYYDPELVTVTDNLRHAIKDWFYGAPAKSTIPTANEIRTYLERRDSTRPRWAS